MQVACDGSNINPIAVKFLQAKNADGTYFIPSSGTAGFTSGESPIATRLTTKNIRAC